MALLATIVVLGVLILVHELGHFWAAKFVGVKVLRFSIGLGPRVLGFHGGDTEYVISAIPLGGYVKMSGMADEVMEKVEGGTPEMHRGPRPTDFDGKPVWARALVLSAGVIMNMIFAFAAYTAVAAGWGSAEVAETRLGYVNMESLPPGAESLAGLPVGARLTRVGDRVVEHWGDVRDGFLFAQAETVTVETEAPRMAVTVPVPEDPLARERLAVALDYWLEAEVQDVEPGMPAARAGLQPGDRVLAVDDVAVENWAFFRQEIMRRPGREVDLRVVRGGALMEFTVALATREERGPGGEVRTIGQAGIFPPVSGSRVCARPPDRGCDHRIPGNLGHHPPDPRVSRRPRDREHLPALAGQHRHHRRGIGSGGGGRNRGLPPLHGPVLGEPGDPEPAADSGARRRASPVPGGRGGERQGAQPRAAAALEQSRPGGAHGDHGMGAVQ